MTRKKGVFYGWMLVIACFIIYFLQGGVPIGLFFKPMLEEFGWNRATLSGVQSFSMVLMAMMGPIVGKLIDKYGPRTIISLGVVGTGVSRIINSVSSNIWHLYVARVTMVIGGIRAVPVLLTRWFLKKRGGTGCQIKGKTLDNLVCVSKSKLPNIINNIINGG